MYFCPSRKRRDFLTIPKLTIIVTFWITTLAAQGTDRKIPLNNMDSIGTLSKTQTTSITYDYALPTDPIGVKIYTLKNGLKLYMSVNRNEPRVFTNIVIRAGSKHDPSETTGLAHYLEHMMFKGTSRIGSLNWEKEHFLLGKLADLYEKHRVERDPSVRKAVYAQIDKLSNEAAQYVAANEYDKLVSALGAKATNAYTSNEQTVYVNDIPSNELERWLQLESERFRMVVLRLFHTELESVYEEFNIGQDNDGRKVYQAMMEALFPVHPYGTQTTIGKGEHLKNPSHYNILKYFDTYYVPNNMAIVLSGDFEPEQAIDWAEKYFGAYQPKEFPPFSYINDKEPKAVLRREVYGHQSEQVQIAWRLRGAQTLDSEIGAMMAALLYNHQAGLMDIGLIQKQKILECSASYMNMTDYSVLVLYGKPRNTQSLEDVETLLIEQIERLKKGDFPDWLMSAVIKDYQFNQTKGFENNQNRVSLMTDAFVKGIEWHHYIDRIDRMKRLTKKQIVQFANRVLGDNYVVVYKKIGEDKTLMKVDKPPITPVVLNRKDKSKYAQSFLEEESPHLKPEFLDFKKAIKTVDLKNGIKMDYVRNTTNETFSLYYIVEMGKWADKKLSFAVSYLPYLGTDKYSAAELQQEFYKLGLSFDVFTNEERSYVVLSGLEESFTEGVRLFEHILKNVKKDEKALKNMVDDILSRRENDKKDKRIILRNALFNYAKYGENSPFTDILSKKELENLDTEELIFKIKSLMQYEHRVFYYGTKSPADISQILNKYHKTPSKPMPIKSSKDFMELDNAEDQILFVHYPMVQTEILMVSKGTPQYSIAEQIMATYYNNYFGAGLSSIVFQEIREARALAYSANAYYSTPNKRHRAHYFQAYVGTQPDKLKEATIAMLDIINNMPLSEAQLENARQSVLRMIESERITKANIYWTYRSNLDKGIEHDLRQDIYEAIQDAGADDLKAFQKKYVRGRKFSFLILGDKARLDFRFLKTIGKVKELSLEEIFGY
jgi:predicted Zn-dependent peptidase